MADLSPPSSGDVYDALEEVIDPELGLDIVSLGLVYDVAVNGESVEITFTLTTPACPLGDVISNDIAEAVGALPGVTEVRSTLVWEPAWSVEMISEDAKFALGLAL